MYFDPTSYYNHRTNREQHSQEHKQRQKKIVQNYMKSLSAKQLLAIEEQQYSQGKEFKVALQRKISKNHKKHQMKKHKNDKTPKTAKIHHQSIVTKDEIFQKFLKRVKTHSKNRSQTMNAKDFMIKKETLTTDNLSHLFFDFQSHYNLLQTSKLKLQIFELDHVFRKHLSFLNIQKRKNKRKSFEIIRAFFTKILSTNANITSHHPFSTLITKYCNLFHGRYSFSPQDFKQKSILQSFCISSFTHAIQTLKIKEKMKSV